MNSALLASITLALYIAAGVCYGAVLFLDARSAPAPIARNSVPPRVARFGRPLLFLGILMHLAAIGALCVRVHRSPFASEYGTLMVAAWGIALAYACLDFRNRLPALGSISLLAACLTLFWGLVHFQDPMAESPLLSQRIVSLHVLATIGSFALFALAGACAGLYLLQNRLLKAHNGKGLFRRLPSLATLDTLAYHAVAYALPLLTLGLSLGILYVYRGAAPLSPWWIDPKTIVSFVVWFIYIAYLTARLGAGWRGVRLQYVLLVGVLVAPTLFLVTGPTHHFR